MRWRRVQRRTRTTSLWSPRRTAWLAETEEEEEEEEEEERMRRRAVRPACPLWRPRPGSPRPC
ncbi:hypothetical protein EYF80_061673 [Liparis tanakae]|uniref:Uncharacterized protein n=1 Tax=Liparis tanakae TaxID=230148 RepID=A0A4Z2EH27_9TELE|nr:hypothetical protein EYF80_061673 [Liparis tanakae]